MFILVLWNYLISSFTDQYFVLKNIKALRIKTYIFYLTKRI